MLAFILNMRVMAHRTLVHHAFYIREFTEANVSENMSCAYWSNSSSRRYNMLLDPAIEEDVRGQVNHSWVLYFLVFPNCFYFFSFYLNHHIMIQERKRSKACRPSIKQISARVEMRHAAKKKCTYIRRIWKMLWTYDYNYMNNMADEPLV